MDSKLSLALLAASLGVSSSVNAYFATCTNRSNVPVIFYATLGVNGTKSIVVAAGKVGHIESGLSGIECIQGTKVTSADGRAIAEFNYRAANRCGPKSVTVMQDANGMIVATSNPAE